MEPEPSDFIAMMTHEFIKAIKKADKKLTCELYRHVAEKLNDATIYIVRCGPKDMAAFAIGPNFMITRICGDANSTKRHDFDPTDPSWDPKKTIGKAVKTMVKQINEQA
jgi:hypothetical protein